MNLSLSLSLSLCAICCGFAKLSGGSGSKGEEELRPFEGAFRFFVRETCVCMCLFFFSVCLFQPEDAKRRSWRGDEGGRSRKEMLFVCLFSLRMVAFLFKLKT
jgi:hypothetical protein